MRKQQRINRSDKHSKKAQPEEQLEHNRRRGHYLFFVAIHLNFFYKLSIYFVDFKLFLYEYHLQGDFISIYCHC